MELYHLKKMTTIGLVSGFPSRSWYVTGFGSMSRPGGLSCSPCPRDKNDRETRLSAFLLKKYVSYCHENFVTLTLGAAKSPFQAAREGSETPRALRLRGETKHAKKLG
jgi:hypothetical protein